MTVRVLVITLRADIGGGPEHVFMLSSHLRNRCEIVIACPKEDPYWTRFSELFGSHSLIELPHRKFRLRYLYRLAVESRRRGIELVHSHGKGAGLYGRLVAALIRKPSIHTFHGLHIGDYRPLTRVAYLIYERVAAKYTTYLISVSSDEKTELVRNKVARSARIAVIANGVRIPPYREGVERNKKLTVAAVSRYDYQKNAELLVSIAAISRDRGLDAKFEVYGTGPGFRRISSAIDSMNLSDFVNLAGSVDDLRPYLARSDVFLSTSRWEGLPLSVLEAMSEGMPVVLTNVTGHRELVSGSDAGLLYDLDNADEAVDRLEYLLDDETRRRMGRSGYGLVAKEYSVDRMAEKTFSMYMAAIEN